MDAIQAETTEKMVEHANALLGHCRENSRAAHRGISDDAKQIEAGALSGVFQIVTQESIESMGGGSDAQYVLGAFAAALATFTAENNQDQVLLLLEEFAGCLLRAQASVRRADRARALNRN